MNYEIVELKRFSGSATTIYSVVEGDDGITLFDHFVNENIGAFKPEVKFIAGRLSEIGQRTGAREQYFRLDEGKTGDGVCALYDDPDSALRLYCIRYGTVTIIIGGGGPKPPGVRAWQDDAKLTLEAETMIKVSALILERLNSGALKWSPDGSQLLGNLIFSDDEE